jgi:hypothetical protein
MGMNSAAVERTSAFGCGMLPFGITFRNEQVAPSPDLQGCSIKVTLSDMKRPLTWRLALPRKSFVNDDDRQGQPQSAGMLV